jgi:hypothetical protein
VDAFALLFARAVKVFFFKVELFTKMAKI